MDVSAVSGVINAMTSGLQAADAQNQAGVSVLKDTMNAEQSVALQLIQAINIPGLGDNLDVKA